MRKTRLHISLVAIIALSAPQEWGATVTSPASESPSRTFSTFSLGPPAHASGLLHARLVMATGAMSSLRTNARLRGGSKSHARGRRGHPRGRHAGRNKGDGSVRTPLPPRASAPSSADLNKGDGRASTSSPPLSASTNAQARRRGNRQGGHASKNKGDGHASTPPAPRSASTNAHAREKVDEHSTAGAIDMKPCSMVTWWHSTPPPLSTCMQPPPPPCQGPALLAPFKELDEERNGIAEEEVGFEEKLPTLADQPHTCPCGNYWDQCRKHECQSKFRDDQHEQLKSTLRECTFRPGRPPPRGFKSLNASLHLEEEEITPVIAIHEDNNCQPATVEAKAEGQKSTADKAADSESAESAMLAHKLSPLPLAPTQSQEDCLLEIEVLVYLLYW